MKQSPAYQMAVIISNLLTIAVSLFGIGWLIWFNIKYHR